MFTPTHSRYFVFTIDYLLPLLVSFSVIALGYFTLYSSFFKINTVSCTLDFHDCNNPSVLVELSKLQGQNIFTLNVASISSRLTSGDFTIRQAILTRQLPNIVKVDLASVFPSVALKVMEDPTWVVLDSHFRVIATRQVNPNVPTVILQTPLTLTIGKSIADANIKEALSLAIRLADELFSLESITLIDDNTISLALSGDKIALLSPKKDEQQQLKALQAILSDATILDSAHTIDVRFTRPVIR